MTWTVEFFEDDQGRQPAREWLQSLDSAKRAAAIEVLLTDLGLDVCGTEHGKQLGAGLFELRIRHDESVIRGKAARGPQARIAGPRYLGSLGWSRAFEQPRLTRDVPADRLRPR